MPKTDRNRQKREFKKQARKLTAVLKAEMDDRRDKGIKDNVLVEAYKNSIKHRHRRA